MRNFDRGRTEKVRGVNRVSVNHQTGVADVGVNNELDGQGSYQYVRKSVAA